MINNCSTQSVGNKSKKNFNLLCHVTLFCISIAFVLFSSASTSPIHSYNWGTDSAIFQIIGKGWANGYLPYIDLFDHKGPLIFLIDDLGYRIGNLWIVQSIFAFFLLEGIFRLLINLNFTIGNCLLFTLGSLFFLAMYYEHGNLTEEYCLPFLMWSMEMQITYIHNEKHRHPPKYALFYGCTFGICLMTRLTNAVIVCAFILGIIIDLAVHGAWQNILENAIAFIIGFMVVVLPFCIYFWEKGAFYDMLYGTLLYNFLYTTEGTRTNGAGITAIRGISEWLKYIPLFLLFALALFEACRKKYIYAFCIGLSAVGSVFVCLGIFPYLHYAMIIIPCYPLLIGGVYEMNLNHKMEKLFIVFYCVVIFGLFLWCTRSFINKQRDNMKAKITYPAVASEILNIIPSEERDSAVAYNIPSYVYLLCDFMPTYKYFANQDWQGEKSQDLMEKIRDEFKTCKAKWIITPEGNNGISDILKESYELVYSTEHENSRWNIFHLNR